MFRDLRLTIGAAMTLFTASPVLAGTVATEQTTGTSTLAAPVSIITSQDLVLGAVFQPTSIAGTSVVSTAGITRVSGGLVSSAFPSPAQAVFTIAGADGQSISVSVPASFDLTRVGGNETITVATSTDLIGLGGSQLLGGAIGGSGTMSFNVGGRVSVGDNAVAGDYAGLLVVTAQYN